MTVERKKLIKNRYRIREPISASPAKETFKADDLETNQPVLMEFLPADLAGDEQAEKRFLREAEAIRELQSPHVVRCFDSGSTETGRPYVVTEWLSGETLAERLALAGRLAPPEAMRIVAQACIGLHEAHLRGIVHRDIKPSNLFLAKDAQGRERVKLVDFGVSKLLRQELTGEGEALGSPLYMSPEQMRSSKDVDPRTDVWSLGVTLYELLAGARPFEAKNLPDLVLAVLNDEPKSLKQHGIAVSPELEAIVSRCLHKRAQQRYGSVGQLLAELRQLLPASDARELEFERPDDAARTNLAGRLPAGTSLAGLAAAVAPAVSPTAPPAVGDGASPLQPAFSDEARGEAPLAKTLVVGAAPPVRIALPGDEAPLAPAQYQAVAPRHAFGSASAPRASDDGELLETTGDLERQNSGAPTVRVPDTAQQQWTSALNRGANTNVGQPGLGSVQQHRPASSVERSAAGAAVYWVFASVAGALLLLACLALLAWYLAR